MKRQSKIDWRLLMVFLVVTILIVFGVILTVQAHDSTVVKYWPCDDKPACLVIHGADTVKVGHGHEVVKHCPKCDGQCIPNEGPYGGGVSVTAMYCSLGCCNTVTARAVCQTVDSSFTYRYGECDWVVWKIKHDSLVDSIKAEHDVTPSPARLKRLSGFPPVFMYTNYRLITLPREVDTIVCVNVMDSTWMPGSRRHGQTYYSWELRSVTKCDTTWKDPVIRLEEVK